MSERALTPTKSIRSPPPSPARSRRKTVDETTETSYNTSNNTLHVDGASASAPSTTSSKLNYAPVWKPGFQNRRAKSSEYLKSVFPAGFQLNTVRTQILGEGENYPTGKRHGSPTGHGGSNSRVNIMSFNDWARGGSMFESKMSDEDDSLELSDPYADYAGPLLKDINQARITSALKMNASITENSACKATKYHLIPKSRLTASFLQQHSQHTISTATTKTFPKVFHAPSSLPCLPNVLQNQRVYQLIRPPSPSRAMLLALAERSVPASALVSEEYSQWLASQRNNQNESVWKLKGNHPSANYSAYQFDGTGIPSPRSLLPQQERQRVTQSLPIHLASAVYVEIRTLNQFLSSVTLSDQFMLIPQGGAYQKGVDSNITPLASTQTTGRESVSNMSQLSRLTTKSNESLSVGSVGGHEITTMAVVVEATEGLDQGSVLATQSVHSIPSVPSYKSTRSRPQHQPREKEHHESSNQSVASATSGTTATTRTSLRPPYKTPPVQAFHPPSSKGRMEGGVGGNSGTGGPQDGNTTTTPSQQLYLQLSPETTFKQLQDHIVQHIIHHIESSLPSLPLTSVYTSEYLTKINQKYYITKNSIQFGLNVSSLDQIHILVYYYNYESEFWKLVTTEEEFMHMKFYATMTFGTPSGMATQSTVPTPSAVQYSISPENPLPMMYTMDEKTEQFLISQIKEKYELRKFLYEQDHPALSIEALTDALNRDTQRRKKKSSSTTNLLGNTTPNPALTQRGNLLATVGSNNTTISSSTGRLDMTATLQSSNSLQNIIDDPKLTVKYLQHLKAKHDQELLEKSTDTPTKRKKLPKNAIDTAPLVSTERSILYPKVNKNLQQLQEYSQHSLPKLELYALNLEQKILKTKW